MQKNGKKNASCQYTIIVSACNCHGYSDKCFFDRNLYNLTGHGGHCIDCEANRDGPNCEHCKPNYYLRSDDLCINCACDPIGKYLRPIRPPPLRPPLCCASKFNVILIGRLALLAM